MSLVCVVAVSAQPDKPVIGEAEMFRARNISKLLKVAALSHALRKSPLTTMALLVSLQKQFISGRLDSINQTAAPSGDE